MNHQIASEASYLAFLCINDGIIGETVDVLERFIFAMCINSWIRDLSVQLE